MIKPNYGDGTAGAVVVVDSVVTEVGWSAGSLDVVVDGGGGV